MQSFRFRLSIGHFLTHPKLLDGLNFESKGWKQRKDKELGTLFNSQHFGAKVVCWNSRIGSKKSDKQVNYSHIPTQTKQQVN
jgi:hypothetical protein